MKELFSEKIINSKKKFYEINQILFESSVPGKYQLEIFENGIYELSCFAAGGGGAGSHDNKAKLPSFVYFRAAAGGGSGSCFVGKMILTKKVYDIVVGEGGKGSGGGEGVKSGATGGDSYIDTVVKTFGGVGGYAYTTSSKATATKGTGGKAPIITTDVISTQINSAGKDGTAATRDTGMSGKMVGSGGTSLLQTYGAGGSASSEPNKSSATNGNSGYIKIVFIGRK